MTIEVEHDIRIFTFGPEIQPHLEQLQREGWIANPSAPPVVVYHLMRPKKNAGHAGLGRVAVDESKVHIIRNGQIVPPS